MPPPQLPRAPHNVPTDRPLPSPAIQTAIRLQAEGKKSLHKDLKQKRREQREQREQRKAAKEEETQRLKQLQEEKERKLQELELLKEAQRQAEILLQEEEQRRRQQHEEMQRTLEIQLREAEQVGASSWCVLLQGCVARGGGASSPSLARGSPGGLEELLRARPTLSTMLLPPLTSGLLGTVCDLGTRDGGVSTTVPEIPKEQEMRTTCPGVNEAWGEAGERQVLVPGWPVSPFLTLQPALAPNDAVCLLSRETALLWSNLHGLSLVWEMSGPICPGTWG